MAPAFLSSSAAAPGVAGERLVIERPPPGAGRGALPVPAVVVVAVVCAMVVLVVAQFVLKARRR